MDEHFSKLHDLWAVETNESTQHVEAPTFGSGFGYVRPARRFQVEQSWAIAAELVRRHPEQWIRLYTSVGNFGGGYILCVVPDFASFGDEEVALVVDGTARAKAADESSSADTGIATTSKALGMDDPKEFVRLLEGAMGWASPVQAPSTTPRVLAYRLISAAMTMTVNALPTWSCFPLEMPLKRYPEWAYSEDFELPPRELMGFPQAFEDSRHMPDLPGGLSVDMHFWGLRRGSELVALVSDHGVFYSGNLRTELVDAYNHHGRRVLPMAAGLLSQYL